MMPPDEAGELSARAAAHHHAAAMRAQQSYANDGNFQNVSLIEILLWYIQSQIIHDAFCRCIQLGDRFLKINRLN
jgi:hypothetical protein